MSCYGEIFHCVLKYSNSKIRLKEIPQLQSLCFLPCSLRKVYATLNDLAIPSQAPTALLRPHSILECRALARLHGDPAGALRILAREMVVAGVRALVTVHPRNGLRAVWATHSDVVGWILRARELLAGCVVVKVHFTVCGGGGEEGGRGGEEGGELHSCVGLVRIWGNIEGIIGWLRWSYVGCLLCLEWKMEREELK